MTSKRKLQVFVSSTYLDLIKERQAAVEAILTSGHIPAGMELFSAGDKSQMDVIKRWINESDVYLLLLGGRYGSIEPESGKSYTQLEYEYAIEKGKPFFALLITEKRLDEKVKSEGKGILELDNPQKLKEFKGLFQSVMVKFWDDERDIKLAILQTLPELERRSDLIGWVPGNEATKSDLIANEIARLNEENSILKSKESFSVSVEQAIRTIGKEKPIAGLTGVPSGLVSIDRLTSGWQPSDLIILAASPSMGKSSFISSILLNAAIRFNMPVAIFTMEMSKERLVNRLISSEIEIDGEKIRRGTLEPHEWTKMHYKVQPLNDAPIFIDATVDLSVERICDKCRHLKLQHNIQMVMIDYLQLMKSDSVKSTNRKQEIASILRTLKNLAKELNIPIIIVVQLGRSVETRGGDKRPQLSDLDEFRSIEENADMIMLLYRGEYYGITQDEMGNSTVGISEVIVAKNRNGSLGTIQLKFIARYTKFTDLDNHFSYSGSNTFDSKIVQPKSYPPLAGKINNFSPSPEDEPPF
jgi:replicative DNA helicase